MRGATYLFRQQSNWGKTPCVALKIKGATLINDFCDKKYRAFRKENKLFFAENDMKILAVYSHKKKGGRLCCK